MKILNYFKYVGAAFGAFVILGLSACSPSPAQLKKTLQEHPDILQAAIEADPKGFFDTIQKAQAKAREQSMAQQMDDEYKRMADELKSPKEVVVASDRAILGSATAAVTIVEWADFNCGHCLHAQETMAKLAKDYDGKIRVLYKHLPILAKESRTAAEYMEAIAQQDKEKAIQFHDLLFQKQREFQTGGEEFLKKLTKELGANLSKVEKYRKSSAVKSRIDGDIAEAKKFEFTGTPGFMVNGAAVHGAYPYEFFKKVIDGILAGGASSAAPVAPAVAPAVDKGSEKKPEAKPAAEAAKPGA